MMNIVMCGNDSVYHGMELCIYSTMYYNKFVNWYILTGDIDETNCVGDMCHYAGLTQQHKDKLQKIVKYLDQDSNIVFTDISEIYYQELTDGQNSRSEFTPYAAIRLRIDKILPYLHHCLYLDCDCLVTEDISGLYKSCQDDYETIYYASCAMDAYCGGGEMVSGVMFYNLDKIREVHFFDLATKYFQNWCYEFPDQSAMRDAAFKNIKYFQAGYGYCEDLSKDATPKPIIHFTNEAGIKIYSAEVTPPQWYRKYPQFKWIEDGLKLIDTF